MVQKLRTLAQYLPPRLQSGLKGTPIHRLYHDMLISSIDTVETSVSCGADVSCLQVPQSSVYTKSNFEPVLTSTLCDRLSAESVFYDVGSQYGYFIALARAAGVPEDQIYGFDMNRFALNILEQNFRDTAVTIVDTKVADSTGPESVSLDTVAAETKPPTIVKIDVEGAEGSVLRGMKATLESARPSVFVEVHPDKLPGGCDTIAVLTRYLSDYGYTLEWCDHRADAPDWKSLSERSSYPTETFLLWAKSPT